MNNRFYISTAVLLLFFTACEKEIDIDYRSVEPLYVVEGRVTKKGRRF
ncbi:MAG: hypothetical protein LUE93_13055 [Bacteroides sp.]|nr:hypothetical protein [Bacteroides sp.]